MLAGGRTGITSIAMGVFFLISLPFHPVFTAVPLFASCPILIVLGSQLLALLPELGQARVINGVEALPPLIDFKNPTEAL